MRWAESVAEAGLVEGFRFHDVRHTGNTLAASSGASTRELMHRMGHASMRCIDHQHARLLLRLMPESDATIDS
jgi:integrase